MTIITRKSIEYRKLKLSGTMRPKASASITPASPAYMDETMNAAPRYIGTLTPMTAAATSLSRIASSARPGRLRSRLRAYQTDSSTSTSPRYHSRSSWP